jgi:hypothetical protein
MVIRNTMAAVLREGTENSKDFVVRGCENEWTLRKNDSSVWRKLCAPEKGLQIGGNVQRTAAVNCNMCWGSAKVRQQRNQHRWNCFSNKHESWR